MALVTIIPGVFTTPGLPTLGIAGFADTFARPDADTLGSTEGISARPWEIVDLSTSSSAWGTTGNGTATMKTADFAGHYAVADAHAADGTLTAALARYDDTDSGRFGLVARYGDTGNMVNLQWDSPSSPRPTLYEAVDGTWTTLGTSSLSIAEGMEFTITLDGSTVTVAQDGVTTITATASGTTGNTKCGMYAFAGSDAEWASITFAAA